MPKPESYDLIVIGGGPAGLSAAVNAASEGLSTLVVDGKSRFGGQAGQASLIENYPGFPDGITGFSLASLMIDQALKFDAHLQAPLRVEGIEPTEDNFVYVRDDNERLLARAVLISSGVEYRKHNAINLAAYLGRGVTYGSPHITNTYANQKLVVVGGANSAGQAAMHLSKFTDCTVRLLIRGESLHTKMSAYLADRIEQTENIEVLTKTEITRADGKGRLQKITIKTNEVESEMDADEIFFFIGAEPRTGWLPHEVARDEHNFILAGGDLSAEVRDQFAAGCGRQPFSRETSIPGVFVAGDVRSNSVKRVTSAVGDGAVVIPEVHRLLSTRAK